MAIKKAPVRGLDGQFSMAVPNNLWLPFPDIGALTLWSSKGLDFHRVFHYSLTIKP